MSSPHFSSGIVERAKRGGERENTAFLAWGDFHARSRFAGSTIPEEKWGLLVVCSNIIFLNYCETTV